MTFNPPAGAKQRKLPGSGAEDAFFWPLHLGITSPAALVEEPETGPGSTEISISHLAGPRLGPCSLPCDSLCAAARRPGRFHRPEESFSGPWCQEEGIRCRPTASGLAALASSGVFEE
ncbi:unnamed protein product [Pleuronectes platessa]|uniref:Uncharacterized protein n=1 Tax=Pleuronectes platessa TaxID=8262 RepID=A0A9N7YEG0_PLEPL|nr:unnamed protein product [Pleuronectes platessa]